MYACFTCLSVCVPPAYLESQMVVTFHADAGVALSGPLHEQYVVLTSEPTL